MDSDTLQFLKELGINTASSSMIIERQNESDMLKDLGISISSELSKPQDALDILGLSDIIVQPNTAINQTPTRKSLPKIPKSPNTHPKKPNVKPIDSKPSPKNHSLEPKHSRNNSRPVSRPDSAGRNMYERGMQYLEMKHENIERVFQNSYTFKPEINRRSDCMMQNQYANRKSLYFPKKHLEILDFETPKPAKSLKKDEKKEETIKDFLFRNYNEALQTFKTKKKQLSPDRDQPDSECTFKPIIDSQSIEIVQKKQIQADIVKRSAEVLERKKIWHLDASRLKKEKETKECSFNPSISRVRSISPCRRLETKQPETYSQKYKSNQKTVGEMTKKLLGVKY